jgi:hypothetical protein
LNDGGRAEKNRRRRRRRQQLQQQQQSIANAINPESIEQWLASFVLINSSGFCRLRSCAFKQCGYEDISFLRDVNEADCKEALVEAGTAKQAHTVSHSTQGPWCSGDSARSNNATSSHHHLH